MQEVVIMVDLTAAIAWLNKQLCKVDKGMAQAGKRNATQEELDALERKRQILTLIMQRMLGAGGAQDG